MDGGRVPHLVSSQLQVADKKYPLLDLGLETNPLDGQCDTRVNLSARPLEIIYDAVSYVGVVRGSGVRG